ncbi:hypothetical protein [Methylocystis sp. ATCC 49242]|uniref:hypothetical protein n=1 Tax=Methylocystis sp. ATCC 49242 TaxID=622637 RepID=UPI0001F86EF7|nr:hypothetical protein [Methylocystis sp. ATCC 49242]
MRTGSTVGDAETAVISFYRLHYGKLAEGHALSVPATAGYGVTRRSRELDPAYDRRLSPSLLMGLRRFEPDFVDEAARRAGCFLARAGAGGSAVMMRARFRPEDGEDGHGRLHQQSAIWVAAFDDWRQNPAACLAVAAGELKATPDLVSEDESARFGEGPLRWRVARPDPVAVRRVLERARWGAAMLEVFARGVETGGDLTLDFDAADFAGESDFLAAVGFALQFLPGDYPRWREISIVSGLRHAPTGLCLRYLPSGRQATPVAA